MGSSRPKLLAWCAIVLALCVTSACQSATRTRAPAGSAVPTAASLPATEAPSQGPQGADSPENAVRVAFRAVEAGDSTAYMDVIDPQFRSNVGNYFFFSQFMDSFTQISGLSWVPGRRTTPVSFRALDVAVIGPLGALTQVRASGFARSAAFAVELPFEDIVLVRQVGGRWFISAPYASETALTVEAASTGTQQQARLDQQRSDVLAQAILSRGEFVALCGLGALALRPGNQWTAIPGLDELRDVNWLRTSPDKRLVAWLRRDPNGDDSSLGVTAIDGRDSRVLMAGSASSGYPHTVNWSPDGQRLIVATSRGSTYSDAVLTVDLSGSQTDILWKGVATDAAFLPDGRRILLSYAQNKGGPWVLAVYDPASGDERRIGSIPIPPTGFVWSPDGKWVAFSTDDGIWTAGADGSDLRRIIDSPMKRTDAGNVWQQPIWSPDGAFLAYNSYATDSIGVAWPDGTRLPGNIPFPSTVGGAESGTRWGVTWWVEGSTPAVKAYVDLLEQGSKERTVSVNLTDQRYGLVFTLREFQVTRERVRVHLVVENTGSLGKVFVEPREITLSIVTPSAVSPVLLRIATAMPSVLPVGTVWDGWLETDVPAPPDAIGATLQFSHFEFEKPYDENGQTGLDWDSTQAGQSPAYQPLR